LIFIRISFGIFHVVITNYKLIEILLKYGITFIVEKTNFIPNNMLYQINEITRVLIIVFMHSFVSILLYFLSFKILRRNVNRMTINLSLFYFLPGTGFLLSLFYFFLSTTSIGYILYFISAFCTLSGFIFLVLVMINLTQIKPYKSAKNQILIIIAYLVIGLIILFIPNGITINESTGTPEFSPIFLIVIYIFFSSVIFLPSLYFSYKIYKSFKDKKLRKKFLFFFIGIIGMLVAFYGLILFNTWYNPTFRAIWTVLVFFIVVPSGILIYYGIIHKL